jgi:MoaA/NifB/PqqE/SkfB family radical SAM enzyme
MEKNVGTKNVESNNQSEGSETIAKNIKKIVLDYDKARWHEKISQPTRTLQLFITNKCNKRCNGCFYEHSLGKDEMNMQEYEELVGKYEAEISKVILLGGEPTIHRNLPDMIKFNNQKNLKTTIYTNGLDLKTLEDMTKMTRSNGSYVDLSRTDIRIGVLGLTRGEKHLEEIKKTDLEVTVVYMLRSDNVAELIPTAEYAEKNFRCKDFFISSIRDIGMTGSYWKDTKDTITMPEYVKIVQDFVDKYDGGLERIHISRRGILTTESIMNGDYPVPDPCRFVNVFPDKKQIICPFDIAKKKYTDNNSEYHFQGRKCDKNDQCLLQKIVLERN